MPSSSTTTYAKRHRQKNSTENATDVGNFDDCLGDYELEHTERSPHKKRNRSHSEDIDTLRKKLKLSHRVDQQAAPMSVHSFQTPLPTLLAQSQVFKLPSSRPQDTPGLLSPVPIVSQETLTSSKKIKETQPRKSTNGNKSWHPPKYGDSSKMLSSMTLASGFFSPEEVSGPALHVHSYRQDGSRSTSCSSSNSSAISTTLKDSQNFHSTLKHSQSLTSLKADVKQKKKQKQKKKSSKSRRSVVLLASPFVSRSSSPAKGYLETHNNAHTLGKSNPNLNQASQYRDMGPPPLPNDGTDAGSKQPKSNMRAGLSDTFFDSNLPGPTEHIVGRPSQRAAKPSPHKIAKSLSRLQRENISKSKTKSQLGFEIDALAPALEEVRKIRKHKKAEEKCKVASERERRPSAPSSLHLPRMQRNFSGASATSLPVGGATSLEGGLAPTRKVRLGSGLDIVLDPRSYHARAVFSSGEDVNDGRRQSHRDSDSSLDWMHARGGIDFNRPPSQMTFSNGYGFEYPDVEATDVFTSSEEEEDDDNVVPRVEDEVHGSRLSFTRGRAPIVTARATGRLGGGLYRPQLLPTVLNFGEDVWGASTPFKDIVFGVGSEANERLSSRSNLADNGYETDLNVVASVKKQRLEQQKQKQEQKTNEQGSAPLALTRAFSLPNLKTSPDNLRNTSSSLELGSFADIGSKKRSASRDGEEEEADEDEDEDEDGERDMELTGSRIQATPWGVKVREGSNSERGEDMTPWVTDSIISPPTGYVQWAIKKGGARMNDNKSDGDRDVGNGQGSEGMGKDRAGRSSDRQHKLLDQLNMLMDAGKKQEGNVVEEDSVGQRGSPTREQLAAQRDQRKNDVLSESTEERASAGHEQGHIHILANTKRTRSGTIVPIGTPIPPGTRRTRGGTIVGPLPVAAPTVLLPSVPLGNSGIGDDSGTNPDFGPTTRRSRSGTITASGSARMANERPRSGSVQRSNRKATPSFSDGDHVILNQRQRFGNAVHDGHNDTEQILTIEASANVEETQIVEEEYEADIECYVDSMYLPALTSSPDPIDFLRFASIVEEDEDNIGLTEFGSVLGGTGTKHIAWRVAEDPPSPEIVKKRGNRIFRGIGFGGGKGWSLTGRAGGRKRKAPHKKAKFAGDLADGEDADEDEIGRNGDTEMSDDELLLLPGTMGDFGSLR